MLIEDLEVGYRYFDKEINGIFVPNEINFYDERNNELIMVEEAKNGFAIAEIIGVCRALGCEQWVHYNLLFYTDSISTKMKENLLSAKNSRASVRPYMNSGLTWLSLCGIKSG